jgi:D-arabinose 1-dehydrogenase-like Zn-dependent alcohol dehydrogenase
LAQGTAPISITDSYKAATIPLAALTAAIVLYRDLELPSPWSPARSPVPLIIYGASSAVGAFAIKLAIKSNIHPIIAISGKSKDLVRDLIDPSQGDIVLDYRDGAEYLLASVQQNIQRLGLQGIRYGFDTIASSTSVELVAQLIEPGGHLNVISPRRDCSAVMETVKTSAAFVGVVHGQPIPPNETIQHVSTGDGVDFGYIYSRLFTRGLEEGWLKGHPFQIWDGGLDDISEAMKNMQKGSVNGKQYIFKIA